MTFCHWTVSAWLAVLLLRPVSAGDDKTKTHDKAPNPHVDSGLCTSCHTSAGGGRETLRFDGSVSRLCQSCHNGRLAAREVHVVDVAPSPTIARRIPPEFPLERGMLTCLSCHDVARSCKAEQQPATPNRNTLRGGQVSEPLMFCFHCHAKEDYRPFNPHDQLEAGKPKMDTCAWCHIDVPDVNAPSPQDASYALRGKSSGVCRNCHTVAQDHPVRSHMQVTPSADMMWYMSAHELQSKMRLPFPQLLKYARTIKRAPRSIPLDENGRITCYSCHNPHEKGLLPSGNPRSVGAEPKQTANHRVRSREGKLCAACHQK